MFALKIISLLCVSTFASGADPKTQQLHLSLGGQSCQQK